MVSMFFNESASTLRFLAVIYFPGIFMTEFNKKSSVKLVLKSNVGLTLFKIMLDGTNLFDVESVNSGWFLLSSGRKTNSRFFNFDSSKREILITSFNDVDA